MRHKSNLVVIAALLIVACRRSGHPLLGRPDWMPELYSSDQIVATLVDAESNAPIEGAVVVAVWRNADRFHGGWGRVFRMEEATSDAAGRFTIPRWGPRPGDHDKFLDERGPELWIVKRGYLIGFFDQAGERTPSIAPAFEGGLPDWVTLPPGRRPGAMRDEARASHAGSIWNGKTLRLRRPASVKEYAESIAAANPYVPFFPQRKNFPLPLYWTEWERAKAALPAELANALPNPPFYVTDYVVSEPGSTAKYRALGPEYSNFFVIEEPVRK